MEPETPLSTTALSHITKEDSIALFGGSGFIGSVLLHKLLRAPQSTCREITLASRNPKTLQSTFKTGSQICSAVECDHSSFQQVSEFIKTASIIIDLAGLAWQHPGGKPLPPAELLMLQLLHNTIPALILATVLTPQQLLVWTSTSAVDTLFARLSPEQQKILESEAAHLAENIVENCTGDLESPQIIIQRISEIIDTFPFASFPEKPGGKTVCFATEFSYAYTKYIGQLLLTRVPNKNIRILKISDVYGPGQDISEQILDPLLPARRAQRYCAAYQQIKNGTITWIPEGGQLYGFTRDAQSKVTQHIWSDWVLPTHVSDVCEMICRALDPQITQSVLNVNGNILTNRELMETLQEYFGTTVDIQEDAPLGFTMQQHSEDLARLGMSDKSLIPFKNGLHEWVEKQ